MKIVLCASASFYKHVVDISYELEKLSHEAILPYNAEIMKKTGEFDPKFVKSWEQDDDYSKVTFLIDTHYKKIENSDAILVINDTKNGREEYVGPNVTMEMGLAYYLNKPIYILNEVQRSNTVYDEVRGMNCIVLYGDLSKIKQR